MSLFKYCDLCNNSTSHQLVLNQVPCSALMITVLALTLACCVLDALRIKVLWNQRLSYPWRPYRLTQSRSPCTRESWRVSVLAAKWSLPSYFPPVVIVTSAKIQFPSFGRQNLSSQQRCLVLGTKKDSFVSQNLSTCMAHLSVELLPKKFS